MAKKRTIKVYRTGDPRVDVEVNRRMNEIEYLSGEITHSEFLRQSNFSELILAVEDSQILFDLPVERPHRFDKRNRETKKYRATQKNQREVKDTRIESVKLSELTNEEVVERKKEIEYRNPISTYLRQISRYKRLSAQETEELFSKAREGDSSAVEKIILGNLKLTFYFAQKRKFRRFSLEDRIQTANLGLVKAVIKFAESKPHINTFSAYASKCIIGRLLGSFPDYTPEITTPDHIFYCIPHWKRISKELEEESGEIPTPEEIYQKLPDCHKATNSEKFLTKFMPRAIRTVDLDNYTDIDDSLEDRALMQTEDYSAIDLRADIEKALSKLKERERQILKLRFGLENELEYTLKEIGKIFGINRERVRQIEKGAIKKLKKYSSKLLGDYIN